MEVELNNHQRQDDSAFRALSFHSSRRSTGMPHELDPNIITDNYTASQHIMGESEEDYVTEDDLNLPDPAPSGRSSISSFPASVVHHNMTPSQTFHFDIIQTPPQSRKDAPLSYNQRYKPVSPLSTRDQIIGFRNPSSVRALQMQDEFSDEDTTLGHRRRGSRMSYISYRSGSAHSTPAKRMSRSLTGSPTKSSRLRKEFPLVLLHCTLLPGMISPKMKAVNEELLEAIIPEPYKRRWKLLQEKVARNFEVRERGVLLPHPKEDFDLLEERLLETLELERPVVSNGHYVGRSESRASAADSGFGSEENSNRGDTIEQEEGKEPEESRCADCGGHLCGDRKWEMKIFAANGLMRAGAWSAVWSEMEKVDVQVNVWLPEDVRREVEARLDAVIAQEQQLKVEEVLGKPELPKDERTKEIYGNNLISRRREEIDGLVDQPTGDSRLGRRQSSMSERMSFRRSTRSALGEINHRQVSQREASSHFGASYPRSSDHSDRAQSASPTIDLRKAVVKYVQLLLKDQRNIAIFLLSSLLIFYGLTTQKSAATIVEFAAQPVAANVRETQTEYLTTIVTSTSTSVALQISTVTETTHFTTLPTLEVATHRVQSTPLVELPEVPHPLQFHSSDVCDAIPHELSDLQMCLVYDF